MAAPRRVTVVSRLTKCAVETPYAIMRVGKFKEWLAGQKDPTLYTAEVMERDDAALLVEDSIFRGYKMASQGCQCEAEEEERIKEFVNSRDYRQLTSWLDWLEA